MDEKSKIIDDIELWKSSILSSESSIINDNVSFIAKLTLDKNHNNRVIVWDNPDWANTISDLIIKKFPNLDTYTLAAWISPSWIVHFWNFRDVMTCIAVLESLKQKWKNVKLIFSWDNFDRFRKVPKWVDHSFIEHIWKPLSSVPDPKWKFNSYAESFQKEFEDSMKELWIEMDFKYQTDEYKLWKYDQLILLAIEKRVEIAKVLLSFMTDKAKNEKWINDDEYIKNFYPLTVYSRFTNKDNTQIINIEWTKITYICKETWNTDTIDFTSDRLVKLNWKIDWPMRWKHEWVIFEPGWKDHAAPWSSYDVSSEIANIVYWSNSPIFVWYEFIWIQWIEWKMSWSAWNAMSVKQLLDIYEPALLKWLYLKKTPWQVFNLAFNSEIYRQYDEFDSFIWKVLKWEANQNELNLYNSLWLNYNLDYNPIPFRQLVSFWQIAQWNLEKLNGLLSHMWLNYSSDSITNRLIKCKNWLEKYNKNESIELLWNKNIGYINNMNDIQKNRIKLLINWLKNPLNIEELNTLIYSIPNNEDTTNTDKSKSQKEFFTDVYNLLIWKNKWPRLATFIYLLNKEKILKLLDI